MSSITITITAATAEEMAAGILQLAAQLRVAPTASEPVPEAPAPEPEAAPRRGRNKPAEPKTEEEPPAPPPVTRETVRATLANLMQAGFQSQVKALFPMFDAIKLSEVPDERLGELLKAAQGIAS